jgi:hypothetical protein
MSSNGIADAGESLAGRDAAAEQKTHQRPCCRASIGPARVVGGHNSPHVVSTPTKARRAFRTAPSHSIEERRPVSAVAVDAKQRRARSIWASVAPRLRAYISATGAEYFATWYRTSEQEIRPAGLCWRCAWASEHKVITNRAEAPTARMIIDIVSHLVASPQQV